MVPSKSGRLYDNRPKIGLFHMYLAYSSHPNHRVSEGLKWYKKAENRGHRQSQYDLGVIYSEGEDVPRDTTEVIKWLKMAAEQNDVQACVRLFIMYGIQGNAVEAEKWQKKAEKLGFDVTGKMEKALKEMQ